MPKLSKGRGKIKKQVINAYLDRESIETWGDKLCNAYCMPAVMIKPYGEAIIPVRITIEELTPKNKRGKR